MARQLSSVDSYSSIGEGVHLKEAALQPESVTATLTTGFYAILLVLAVSAVVIAVVGLKAGLRKLFNKPTSAAKPVQNPPVQASAVKAAPLPDLSRLSSYQTTEPESAEDAEHQKQTKKQGLLKTLFRGKARKDTNAKLDKEISPSLPDAQHPSVYMDVWRWLQSSVEASVPVAVEKDNTDYAEVAQKQPAAPTPATLSTYTTLTISSGRFSRMLHEDEDESTPATQTVVPMLAGAKQYTPVSMVDEAVVNPTVNVYDEDSSSGCLQQIYSSDMDLSLASSNTSTQKQWVTIKLHQHTTPPTPSPTMPRTLLIPKAAYNAAKQTIAAQDAKTITSKHADSSYLLTSNLSTTDESRDSWARSASLGRASYSSGSTLSMPVRVTAKDAKSAMKNFDMLAKKPCKEDAMGVPCLPFMSTRRK